MSGRFIGRAVQNAMISVDSEPFNGELLSGDTLGCFFLLRVGEIESLGTQGAQLDKDDGAKRQLRFILNLQKTRL